MKRRSYTRENHGQSSYLSGLLKQHHHLSTRDVMSTLEDEFLESLSKRDAVENESESEYEGVMEERSATTTPEIWAFCNNVNPYSLKQCTCESLICKGGERRTCVFSSVQLKMALSCHLKRAVTEITDIENLTKNDCECKFRSL